MNDPAERMVTYVEVSRALGPWENEFVEPLEILLLLIFGLLGIVLYLKEKRIRGKYSEHEHSLLENDDSWWSRGMRNRFYLFFPLTIAAIIIFGSVLLVLAQRFDLMKSPMTRVVFWMAIGICQVLLHWRRLKKLSVSPETRRTEMLLNFGSTVAVLGVLATGQYFHMIGHQKRYEEERKHIEAIIDAQTKKVDVGSSHTQHNPEPQPK